MDQFKVVNQKLDLILENQQRLFEGQQQILKSIYDLSKQISQVESNLLSAINENINISADILEAIMQEVASPLVSCDLFVKELNNVYINPQLDKLTDIFNSRVADKIVKGSKYYKRFAHFARNRSLYHDCNNNIFTYTNKMSNDGTLHSVFTINDDLIRLLKERYTKDNENGTSQYRSQEEIDSRILSYKDRKLKYLELVERVTARSKADIDLFNSVFSTKVKVCDHLTEFCDIEDNESDIKQNLERFKKQNLSFMVIYLN